MASKVDDVLAGAAADLDDVAGLLLQEGRKSAPDCRMISVKGRSVQPAIRFDRPAIPAEFHHVFHHGNLSSPHASYRQPIVDMKGLLRLLVDPVYLT